MTKPIGTEYWTLFPPSFMSTNWHWTWYKYRVTGHDVVKQDTLFHGVSVEEPVEIVQCVDMRRYPVDANTAARLMSAGIGW